MSRQNTLRVTEFKGLNKATNPHNIHDAELVTLENMFVSKNRGLESRKGFRRIGDATGNFINGIFTTPWSSTDERLYFTGNGYLAKMADDGTVTTISSISNGTFTEFDRYHDKVLMLGDGYLNWFNEDENLSNVKYPELTAATGSFGVTITNAAGGALEPDTYYQYCISLILGDDYLDGETSASRPAQGYTGGIPHLTHAASHPYYLTSSANKTLVGADVEFSGPLYGYNIGRVNLYRRKVQAAQGGDFGDGAAIGDAEAWYLIDTANITLDGAAGTYSMDTAIYGFITDITGTYDSTNDSANLLIDFTDKGVYEEADGTDDDVVNGILQSPWEQSDVDDPQARYLARLYNRVFLANILNTGQKRDSKKVYYSYRGWQESIGDFEISGVSWPHPMLIFP